MQKIPGKNNENAICPSPRLHLLALPLMMSRISPRPDEDHPQIVDCRNNRH